MATPLSPQQRKALECIKTMRDHGVGPRGLGRVLETSPEGAAATASSLVRRGLAQRIRVGGHVRYRAVS